MASSNYIPMLDWPAQKIRKTFLDFFVEKKHLRVPSFSLIPANDPTLLFIAAGMAPFKREFAGLVKPPQKRIVTCQRCLRADDLSNVGVTSRHHTFFEMLGNFSFGDYFKKEAIAWAWELLTHVYHFPAEQLWVSVHNTDQEAHSIWNQVAGLPKERIVFREDNFWGPIGKTGVCGPDSEIYFDRGAFHDFPSHACLPGCEVKNSAGKECERFLELWNLVFTMYEKEESGNLRELPQRNIDTGAGLERFATILQKKNSPYETDLFQNIVLAIHKNYANSPLKVQQAVRLVADHIRAAAYLIADQVIPSNEGRGYVLRRIVRRASIHCKQIPGAPFLHQLIPSVVSCAVEETTLDAAQSQIERVLKEEEKNFAETLEKGLALLEEEFRLQPSGTVFNSSQKIASGSFLFRLHDECGFPFELAREYLREKEIELDEKGFHEEMEKQRLRSRSARQIQDTFTGTSGAEGSPPTEFLGYETLETEAKVLSLLRDGKMEKILREKENGSVILDRSPFYAESGGQIGDTGILRFANGLARILDTQQNEGGTFFHKISVENGELQVGAAVQAAVDQERRREIRKHHSATHLLLAALRKKLGTHVHQEGSYVCDQYLRLDFSHPTGVTGEELAAIEAAVNREVAANLQVKTTLTSLEEAKKQGALTFFGDRYGSTVRMISMEEFSKELCGGTHVQLTGTIGPFFILRESSIAKGIRRIEAKAGNAAIAYLGKLQDLRIRLSERFSGELENLVPQVELLLQQKQEGEKEIQRLRKEIASFSALSLLEKTKKIGPVSVLLAEVKNQGKEDLRVMLDTLKNKMDPAVILLASPGRDRVFLACGVSPGLTRQGLSALELIRSVSPIIKGGGGGRADLAEAGGKDSSRLQEVYLEAEKWIQKNLEKITN